MIEIKDLVFSYGKEPVLKNITTTLEEGRIYGLLGENGVGKTTLLTLLCGLKKVDQGSILTDGENPFDRTPSLLEKQFYLPDEVAPVPARAERYAWEKGRFWPNYDHEKFLQIMKEFENDPTQKMNQMSSGQLKKTYISLALAAGCKYLFMDEPTNGLDIPSKAQFRSAIMSHTSEESTIVISTHQVRDLENIIDPVIILDKQDVLLNASMEEISSKLYFDYGTTLVEGSLFREQLPGGFIQVYTNYYMVIRQKMADQAHHFRTNLVKALLLAMFYDMSNVIWRVGQSEDIKTRKRADSLFTEFIALLEENVRTERRVSWYAEQIGITPKYLSEMVKQVSKRTPNEWIDNYVMLEIRVLLKNTTKSIKEIADAVNFPNQSFLGKFIKEHMGMSPSEFRKS